MKAGYAHERPLCSAVMHGMTWGRVATRHRGWRLSQCCPVCALTCVCVCVCVCVCMCVLYYSCARPRQGAPSFGTARHIQSSGWLIGLREREREREVYLMGAYICSCACVLCEGRGFGTPSLFGVPVLVAVGPQLPSSASLCAFYHLTFTHAAQKLPQDGDGRECERRVRQLGHDPHRGRASRRGQPARR